MIFTNREPSIKTEYPLSDHGNDFRFSRVSVPIILICLAVFACYANSFHNGFVSDDHYIIELNREPPGFESLIKAFTSADRLVATDETPYYRPLNRYSYILDHHFFGLNPTGYHAVNIGLHAICAILLYLTLLRQRCGPIPSLGAALLFGVHPVNSEAVNFISARNNILAAIFMLGSFLVFLRAEKNGGRDGHILSGFLFFLGILSKETALMLLPLLFFLKTFRRGGPVKPGKLLKSEMGYILPHTLFLAVYLSLRFVALDNDYIHDHLSGLPQRVWQLVYILPKYFSLVIAPRNLNFFYQVPDSFVSIAFPLAAAWILLAAATAYLVKARNDAIIFGLAWFVCCFIPISNLVPIPSAPMAERYFYLPFIGVLVVAADRLHHFSGRFGARRQAYVAVIFLVAACGYLTYKRNYDWRDNLALSKSLVRSDPSSSSAHFELGYEFLLRGDGTMAGKEWERAVQLHPPPAVACRAYSYLGGLSLLRHHDDLAERCFAEAATADKRNPSPHLALATLYFGRGRGGEARHEYRMFLKTVNICLTHLIPEANGRIEELERKPHSSPQRPILAGAEGIKPGERWRLYKRLASGTELYYDAGSIRIMGDDVTVSARYLLGKSDKWLYALRFVRFPLSDLAEVRYLFEMKGPMGLYKTLRFEFRDSAGNLLGVCEPEREYQVRYEYAVPGTSMWTLVREVRGK